MQLQENAVQNYIKLIKTEISSSAATLKVLIKVL